MDKGSFKIMKKDHTTVTVEGSIFWYEDLKIGLLRCDTGAWTLHDLKSGARIFHPEYSMDENGLVVDKNYFFKKKEEAFEFLRTDTLDGIPITDFIKSQHKKYDIMDINPNVYPNTVLNKDGTQKKISVPVGDQISLFDMGFTMPERD